MLDLEIPGWNALHLRYLVLDVNGTLTSDGVILDGVDGRLREIRTSLDIRLLSADTFGRLDALSAQLHLPATRLRRGDPEAQQKERFVQALGAHLVVAIGNGANDAAMLRSSRLGIAVLGPEGLATEALGAADVVTGSIADALDLLRLPTRLVATQRR